MKIAAVGRFLSQALLAFLRGPFHGGLAINKTMFRQGDVLLVVETRQRTFFDGPTEAGERVILAHGERTGHSHSVSALDAQLREEFIQGAVTRFLDVRRATTLCHEEHAPISLATGTYRVIVQRQYDPIAEGPVHD